MLLLLFPPNLPNLGGTDRQTDIQTDTTLAGTPSCIKFDPDQPDAAGLTGLDFDATLDLDAQTGLDRCTGSCTLKGTGLLCEGCPAGPGRETFIDLSEWQADWQLEHIGPTSTPPLGRAFSKTDPLTDSLGQIRSSPTSTATSRASTMHRSSELSVRSRSTEDGWVLGLAGWEYSHYLLRGKNALFFLSFVIMISYDSHVSSHLATTTHLRLNSE